MDYYEELFLGLKQEDIELARNILNEPKIQEGEARRLYSDQVLHVANYLKTITSRNDFDISALINGIRNNQERIRIRNGHLSGVPDSILGKLNHFEKLFFCRGRWEIQEPDTESPLYRVVVDYLNTGLGCLQKARRVDLSTISFPNPDKYKRTVSRINGSYEEVHKQ